MEVVVITGAIRRAKSQSNHHHQQTNTQCFTGRMSFLTPNQQCQSNTRYIHTYIYILVCGHYSSPVSLLRALVISKVDYCSAVLAGSPAVLLNRLQSVLNAAARLVFSARKFNHTISLLCELHWLKVPEWMKFRLCVLTHRCLHDMAPCYLAETIHPVSSCASWRHLWSADTSELIVPSTRCSRIGDRAFPAAAARAWNSLPPFVRDAPSQVAFRRELKTFLFRSSFPAHWQLTTDHLCTYCSDDWPLAALGFMWLYDIVRWSCSINATAPP